MTAWRWIREDVVYAVHDRQLAEHGGLDGLRDQGAVESALARPRNVAENGDPDAADLAASYAFAFARNHGFADGNKCTAWVIARVFLADNGYRLRCDAIDAVRTVERLPAGTIDEPQLAAWFRERVVSETAAT